MIIIPIILTTQNKHHPNCASFIQSKVVSVLLANYSSLCRLQLIWLLLSTRKSKCTCIHTHRNVFAQTRTCTHTHTNAFAHTHSHTNAHEHTHTHTIVHTHTHNRTHRTYTRIHTHTDTIAFTRTHTIAHRHNRTHAYTQAHCLVRSQA